MSRYCDHCYSDFSKNWVVDYEHTGFCTACVTHNPSIRAAAQAAIQRRTEKPARDAQMETLSDAFKAGDSLRVDATHAATFLPASELQSFIYRCESFVDCHRRRYAVPRFGFGGKDTDDVLSMLNCIRVMKEALSAKRVVQDNAGVVLGELGKHVSAGAAA